MCQVLNPGPIECPEQESGGYYCEVLGSHEFHWISDHTIHHAIAGNGYSCGAI